MLKRKTLAWLLAMLMLLSLMACGTDGGSESSTPSAPSVESSAPENSETTTTSVDGTTTATTTQSNRSTTSRRPNTTEADEPTTTKKSTTTTTMSREQYLNQEKITIAGSPDDLKGWIYTLGQGGIAVRETVVNSGKGGEPVEIVQMTDIHFNKILPQDLEGKFGPVIKAMQGYRTHMANGAARVQAENCLKYASFFDQTVITGDTIDFLTQGAIDMVHDVIWAKDPNALIALGNHDSVRTWAFKGTVKDDSTRESRYEILQKNWKHDIFYTSKVIGNKAMVVQMENGALLFYDEQITKLKADIEKAKQNGYVILLFFHIPIATGKEEDEKVLSLHPDGQATSFTATDLTLRDEKTKEMYDLIVNNADVIKGIYTGHEHEDYYTEVKAKTSDGKDAVIPQYILAPAYCDKGHVMKITVK